MNFLGIDTLTPQETDKLRTATTSRAKEQLKTVRFQRSREGNKGRSLPMDGWMDGLDPVSCFVLLSQLQQVLGVLGSFLSFCLLSAFLVGVLWVTAREREGSRMQQRGRGTMSCLGPCTLLHQHTPTWSNMAEPALLLLTVLLLCYKSILEIIMTKI